MVLTQSPWSLTLYLMSQPVALPDSASHSTLNAVIVSFTPGRSFTGIKLAVQKRAHQNYSCALCDIYELHGDGDFSKDLHCDVAACICLWNPPPLFGRVLCEKVHKGRDDEQLDVFCCHTMFKRILVCHQFNDCFTGLVLLF